MQQRDNYFSLMKGIAIIGVLFIHSEFFSDASALAARQFVTFSVAMFYFVAGYFANPDKSVWRGVRRFMIPYCIWSVLWFAETTVSGSQPVDTWKIINTIFFGGAFFPLYFLIVLAELKLITPWLARHIQKPKYSLKRDWVLLITPITLIVLYAIQYQTRQQPLVYAQIFPTWLLFYYTGMLYKYKKILVKGVYCAIGVLCGIYLMTLESTYINEVLAVPFWAATQLKFSSFIYSFCLCLLFVTLHQQVRRSIIVRLGEMSFGIFLLHLPVLKVVSPILARVGLQGFAFTQLLSIATTLAICYCVLLVTHKFLPKNLNRWLGFA